MANATIIGLDLAKNVFHAHGASESGSVVFRKKLTRNQVLPFLSEQPGCIVAMEACATAHGCALCRSFEMYRSNLSQKLFVRLSTAV